MNRRSFLSRSLLSAASFGVGGALPSGRRGRFGIRSAEAAQLPTPYPIIQIHVYGGWDPAMQMVATPNGSYGNVTLVNRLPGTSSFKTTTKSKITYVPSVITPTGKTDFEPHLDDVALIRVMDGPSDHFNVSGSWFGRAIASSGDRFARLPWASQLAAQFRQRGVIVPKPVSVAYSSKPVVEGEPWRDLVAYGTQSPDPTTRADRILSIQGYFDALSAVGLPKPGVQTPAFDLIDGLDQVGPTATQPDYSDRFFSANKGTTEVLKRLSGGSKWPPPPDVLAKLGLTAASANKQLDLLGANPPYEHMFALAYLSLANGLSHVIGFRAGGGWDSHIENVTRQTTAGNALWPALGKFITLLKETPSIIDPSKSMFDTTHIWVHSEIGRSPDYQTFTKGELKGRTDGTKHWRATSSLFMGGRFKRGIAVGKFSPAWQATPVNLVTGLEAGGITLGIENAIATVMKASGGDPSQFTNAAPIDALLDMSRF